MPGDVTRVVVVGAGVIGSSVALALAGRGVSVTLVERGRASPEAPGDTGAASWAAAGILGAQIATRSDGPFFRLCLASRDRFADWARSVESRSGKDVELRPSGVTKVAFDPGAVQALEDEVAWQEAAGVRVERLDAAAVRQTEPALGPEVEGGVRFPDDARVDPVKLLGAVRLAAQAAGASFRTGAGAKRVLEHDGAAIGVELADGTLLTSDAVVLAAGSWSPLVEQSPLSTESVFPARGQMVELKLPAQILQGVVEGPEGYLSPRNDGRVLVGATIEAAGFEAVTTAGAIERLLGAARRLVPSLDGARLVRTWAGLRPRTADDLPLLGQTTLPRLFAATGHFRNGVLLAPITAEILAAQVLGEAPPVDVTAFDPTRPAPERTPTPSRASLAPPRSG